MKSAILKLIFVSCLFALALSACKKDEEKAYMNGTLSISHNMPYYVTPGESYTLKASGISRPDGGDVAYYFTNGINSVKDTLFTASDVFKYTVPDTLGTFTMSCIAYAVGGTDTYYTSSDSFYYVVVNDSAENGSLTGLGGFEDAEQYMLHGKRYYTFDGGGKTWIRSNLAYVETAADGSFTFGHPYFDSPAMLNIFGSYYTWEEARKACPDGWHLPSEDEWVALLKDAGAPSGLQPLQDSPSGAGALMVKASFNGDVMWDYYRDVNITNKFFSAIPVGYALFNGSYNQYPGYASYAVFWTSDEFEGKGVYRYIYKEYDRVYVGYADKNGFGANVRCVK